MDPSLQERWLATREAAIQRVSRRVVVTGMGVVAPSRIGVDALWGLLRRGESAVRPVSRFDVREYPVRIAAQIPEFRPRQFMSALKARTAGRFCQLTIAASRLAVDDARLDGDALASPRAGFFLGTSAGAVQIGADPGALFRRHGPGTVP